MSTASNNNDSGISNTCANCGKMGSDVTNTCNKCKSVMYCNAACKKKHKKKHKKACDRQVAELHDEKLFKQPPSQFGDCPICFLRMPTLSSGYRYMGCCGKVICSGCIHAPVYDNQGNKVDNDKQNECAFCRVVAFYTMGEAIEREKKRMEKDDPIAIYNIGCNYRDGIRGFPQDHTKALELFHRAAELGNSSAYNAIGRVYHIGQGIEVDIDMEKTSYYWVLGAMKGDVYERHNLGVMEGRAGNMDRALKHYTIAVKDGNAGSLKMIKELHSNGLATKDDYTKALQSYQTYLAEIKSAQRDKAAAFNDWYRYY